MTFDELQIENMFAEIKQLQLDIKIKTRRKQFLLRKIYGKRYGQKQRGQPLTQLPNLKSSRRKIDALSIPSRPSAAR